MPLLKRGSAHIRGVLALLLRNQLDAHKVTCCCIRCFIIMEPQVEIAALTLLGEQMETHLWWFSRISSILTSTTKTTLAAIRAVRLPGGARQFCFPHSSPSLAMRGCDRLRRANLAEPQSVIDAVGSTFHSTIGCQWMRACIEQTRGVHTVESTSRRFMSYCGE